MKTSIFNLSILAVFWFFNSCQFVEEEEEKVSLKDLRITNEVSGWNETDYLLYDVDGLLGLINGGADPYINGGMVEGINQKMGKDPKLYEAFVMDFVTEAAARAMYEEEKSRQTWVMSTVGNYPESQASIYKNPLSGTVKAYAYMKNYFFWISLQGSSDQDELIAEADLFFQFYDGKI
ncbi:hypothetical protein ACFL5V_05470 [Fibrobacterota bacterium]